MQQSGKAIFRINKEVNDDQWRAVWAREGFDIVPDMIYFYESPPGGSNGVWGYFSFCPTPGTPHRNWTPERDDAGELWGWTFVSEDWTIEISKFVCLESSFSSSFGFNTSHRPNVKQYIRYVQL
jgi:hypothetical protein